MRQLVHTRLITNNRALFLLWWNGKLVKHHKVSKYYENDCRRSNFKRFVLIYILKPTSLKSWTTVVLVFSFFCSVMFHNNISPLPRFKPACFFGTIKLSFKKYWKFSWTDFLIKKFYQLPARFLTLFTAIWANNLDRRH